MSIEKSEKQVLLDNITYYLEKTGMKIGELEAKCGVSTGYISRLYKEDKAKPSFEFVRTVSKIFHVSMDTMVYMDQSLSTATETYVFDFLTKLERDTTLDKLSWQAEYKSEFQPVAVGNNQYEVDHPLLTYGYFKAERIDGGYGDILDIGFVSQHFRGDTIFEGPCYHLPISHGVVLYLMPIKRPYLAPETPDISAVEVWMVSKAGGEKKYLCSTLDTSALGHMTDVLYHAVLDYFSRPNLSLPFKEAIDAFMGDTPPDRADKEETDGN